MRYTQLFGRTQRTDPAEAESASHRLLLKAGMVYPVAAGVYSYMPLAWCALRKIEAIVRQEMDAIGGQELKMPTLQPLEDWEETGRARAFGQNLFTLKDRRDRPLVLAPTHEEVITAMVRAHVSSYRDLPLVLYQIQTKFRDEPRPRGGLIRVREFDMKDAYSFHADDASLDEGYLAMAQAYRNIFARCGLPAVMVEADSGAIGGKDSHEFMLLAESGEDTVITCPSCSYAANAEKARSRKPPSPQEAPLPLEEVLTPGCKTIEQVASYLGVPHSKTLKAVFYWAEGHLAFVILRGDLQVNEIKLKRVLKVGDLRLATEEEASAAGIVAGFASPIGFAQSVLPARPGTVETSNGVLTIADESIQLGSNFVVGANRPDHHFRNASYPRDFQVDLMADISLAEQGHGCPHCAGTLQAHRGIEVGHIFKLGTFFSETLAARYLDREGQQRPMVMGCYGIGTGRLLAAAIEQNHDERGMLLPPPIAPYQVYLCALNLEEAQVASAADEVYNRLSKLGFEVLFDDRYESAGVKFNDADLLGFPVRLVVSPRTLKETAVEVKGRREKKGHLATLDQLPQAIQQYLNPVEEVPHGRDLAR